MLRKQDILLEKWLNEFKSPNTRKVYKSGIRDFAKKMNITDLEEYVLGSPDVTSDLRKYLRLIQERPTKTIHTYIASVKSFLQDNGVKIPDTEWKKLKRRGFMPKRIRAETRDRAPTKQQLKKVLQYVDIKGKALILFLASSGARIGETLSIPISDFNLESDPPRVFIKNKFTKDGVGERTVFFSYEARDALKAWLAIKDKMGKRDGSTHKDPRMFPFVQNTANDLLQRAFDKAGLGEKDKRTNRRIYHLHSFRKFFRTKIGLDLDMTNSLLGHCEYLDSSYLRQEEEEIAKAYLEAMPNVSVYELQNQELKEKTVNLEDENRELRERLADHDARMAKIENMLEQLLNEKA